MRRSQSFAHSRTLLERRVLPALAGWDCCDDLRRRDGTPGDLGPIRARQLGRFSVLAVKQQQLIPVVFFGSVDNQANIEYRQIIFFFYSFSVFTVRPVLPPQTPEGQHRLLKIPLSSAGPGSHQQKVPLNGVLNQGLCLLPAAWSVGGSSLLEGSRC